MTGFFAISSIVFGNHVSCEHFGSISKSEQQNRNPAPAIAILRGGATERVRDDFLMQRIKKSSRTSAVRDDDVSCEHYGSTIKFEVRNLNPWLAIVILKESAVKRDRDDFFLHSTMQARKLNSSGDAAVTTAVYLCSSLFCYIGCISVHLLSYYNHVQNQKQTSGENNPLDQYILVLAQTGRQ